MEDYWRSDGAPALAENRHVAAVCAAHAARDELTVAQAEARR